MPMFVGGILLFLGFHILGVKAMRVCRREKEGGGELETIGYDESSAVPFYSHLSLTSLAIFWIFSASSSFTFSASPMTCEFQVSLTEGKTRF